MQHCLRREVRISCPSILLVDRSVGWDAVEVVQEGTSGRRIDPAERLLIALECPDALDVRVKGNGHHVFDDRGAGGPHLSETETLVTEIRLPGERASAGRNHDGID